MLLGTCENITPDFDTAMFLAMPVFNCETPACRNLTVGWSYDTVTLFCVNKKRVEREIALMLHGL